VTLLGDAAHPMFPFFAQGAAQPIEGAAAASHSRAHVSHLPDGPEQRERDAAFARQDPRVANGWIYSCDPSSPSRIST
jgi:salicylate hydroxylase